MLLRLLIAVAAVLAAHRALAVVALEVGPGLTEQLQESRGQLWGVANNALWRMGNDQLKQVFKYHPEAAAWVRARQNEVLFQNDMVLFRLDGDQAERVSERVDRFAADDDGIVIQRGDRLFRVNDGVERQIAKLTAAGWLRFVEGRAWVTDQGKILLVDKDTLRAVTAEPSDLIEVNGRAFVMTAEKLYRLEADGSLTLLARQRFANPEFIRVGGEAWFTVLSSFRDDGSGFVRLKDATGTAEIVHIGGRPIGHAKGKTWFKGRDGITVVADNGKRSVIRTRADPEFATEHAGLFYYADFQTLYVLDGTEEKPIVEFSSRRKKDFGENLDPALPLVRTWKNHVYAAGDRGAYVIDGLSARQLTDKGIRSVFVAGDHLWLSGWGTLLRIDDDVDIVYDIVSAGSWWKQVIDAILPGAIPADVIRVSPRYARRYDGRDPYSSEVPRTFQTAISIDEKSEEFKNAKTNIFDLDPGVYTLYISVRDDAGNRFDDVKRIKVIPGPLAASIALWIAGALGVAFVLLLAPWVSWCQSLVLNPFVQKYATFGSLKLILSVFPSARRHLMRRYRVELRKDLDARAKCFVMPALQLEPMQMAAALQTHRRLLIKGQSGIGKTAYLQYLAWQAAQGRLVDHAIPILIPVARYRGRPILDAIAAQLAAYGHISDRNSELLSWFVDEGSFLVLFDGLNEVDAQTRQDIRVFIDRHWKRNYFVAASQEAYEFDDLHSISLLPLGEPEIRKFLTSRLDEVEATLIIDEILAHRDVYGIAQNLEFVVDLIADGRPIPRTADELCAAVLEPVVKSAGAGGIDFTQPLAMRAFEMIRTREIYVDSDDVVLPAGVISELRKRKLVIQRDEKTYFSHNLVRDFLAARYLRSNWKDIIPKQTIDADWRATLDLLACSLEADELHALLNIVLEKNQRVAGDLFRSMPSDRRAGWGETFERTYGRAVLTASQG